MSKIIKTISLLLIAIFLLPLLLALFISRDFNYEKSVVINAPVEVVWQNVSTFEKMNQWDPLNSYDPNLKKSLIGEDGKIGTEQFWKSTNEEIGKGSQTFKKIAKPNMVVTKVKYVEPYENQAEVYIKLNPTEKNKTNVVWGFKSEIPYPLNLTKLFSDVYELAEKDYTNGLNKLKKLCERG